MNAREMWALYSTQHNITADYQAWQFGSDPDKLAQLVLDGIKTGTSSAYLLYEKENQELPKVEEYSLVLDSEDEAVCIIRTTKVYIVPFDEVSDEHACKEGEGDRSLQFWRRVHEDFFKDEFREAGLPFNYQIKVVCEEFIRVFP